MHASRLLTVDCGAAHVAVARFAHGSDCALTLEGFSAQPLATAGAGEEAWLAEVGAALRLVGRREGWRGACLLGLPGHLTLSRIVGLPGVAPSQRRRILRFEAMQGMAGETVCGQLPVSRGENGVEVALTTMRRATMNALCAQVRSAGFHPVAAWPAWLVLRAGFDRVGGAVGEALVLGIGARSTHLVCCGSERLFARTLTLGGDAITRRIAEEIGTDWARAEQIKLRIGTRAADVSPPDEPEARAFGLATDQFVQRLCGEISRSLAWLCPDQGAPVLRLYLTGGGALLPNLPAVLAERLRLPVERWKPLGQIRVSPAVAERATRPECFQLADMVGLASCALSRESAQVSLLPRTARQVTLVRQHWPSLVAAAALAVGALLVPILRERAAADRSRAGIVEVERRTGNLRRAADQNRAALGRLGETNRTIEKVRQVVDARKGWVRFLAYLHQRLEGIEDAWLERVQVLPTVASPAAPAALRGSTNSPCAVRLALTGCLLDPDHPREDAGEGLRRKAQAVLERLRASPFVAALENERFEGGRPGVLRFEVTVEVAARRL